MTGRVLIDHFGVMRDTSAIASLVDAGLIQSTATRTLDALTPDTLREGHELSESGKMIGKIVLPGIDG